MSEEKPGRAAEFLRVWSDASLVSWQDQSGDSADHPKLLKRFYSQVSCEVTCFSRHVPTRAADLLTLRNSCTVQTLFHKSHLGCNVALRWEKPKCSFLFIFPDLSLKCGLYSECRWMRFAELFYSGSLCSRIAAESLYLHVRKLQMWTEAVRNPQFQLI